MDQGEDSYRRYLAGDDDGLAALVRLYRDGLMLFLNGYVGDLTVAEELAEDTFFRLMVKKPRFSGKSSFRSFLYGIGRHIALDYLRRGARSQPLTAEEADQALRDEHALERHVILEERKRAVHAALSELPRAYRQVLELVYFEGFAPREAGDVLAKNERQMKNLLYRARQALRLELEKDGFDYEDL